MSPGGDGRSGLEARLLSPLGRTLSGAAGGRPDGPTDGREGLEASKMAQTQGTRRKVCYYYDGEHCPRGGGGAWPGRIREREAEAI